MNSAQLIKAIDDYFSDTSRSPQEIREGLEEAVSHAEIMIESLPS